MTLDCSAPAPHEGGNGARLLGLGSINIKTQGAVRIPRGAPCWPREKALRHRRMEDGEEAPTLGAIQGP